MSEKGAGGNGGQRRHARLGRIASGTHKSKCMSTREAGRPQGVHTQLFFVGGDEGEADGFKKGHKCPILYDRSSERRRCALTQAPPPTWQKQERNKRHQNALASQGGGQQNLKHILADGTFDSCSAFMIVITFRSFIPRV